ncbi:MAG TPA: hypothetical protein VHO25_04165, partial [Polyangiaceae bacterium]|nr:hypothetical protein [Polyangiaceae bacterium]
MRSNLGYQVAALDVPVETETPSGIRYVDIRGETYPTVWQRLQSLALVAFVAAIIARNAIPVPEGGVPVVANSLGGLALTSYLAALLGRRRTRRYAWVACLGIENLVRVQDISTLQST